MSVSTYLLFCVCVRMCVCVCAPFFDMGEDEEELLH